MPAPSSEHSKQAGDFPYWLVALVVIGPKDLPRALRTAGMWARKARTISREFQSSIEQMVREAELDDVKKEIEAATSINLENEIKPLRA